MISANLSCNRRDFMRQLGIGGLLLCTSSCMSTKSSPGNAESAVSATKTKPNILFIIADDQCFSALHAAGNEQVKTPNLDRLAARGVCFTHAYNQGAWGGAVCVASRAMLNTGLFLWNAHKAESQYRNNQWPHKFWSEQMKDAGYKTCFSGKWHVKTDPAKLFDVVRHVRPGMPNQTKAGYNRPQEGQVDPWQPWNREYGGFWKDGKHWSEVLRDDGLDYLEDAADSEQPFFMYLAFNAPHDPRQSPKEYVDMYPVEEIDVPVNYQPVYPYKEDIGCGERLRDERLAPFPRTEYAVKVHRQEYYAIITHMDDQIGRILHKLEALGLDKTTTIFFTADHGLAVGKHGLMGKQNMFDHSVRAPLLAAGPGIPPGRTIDCPVYLQDIMPSCLELAGAAKPGHVQFRSLMPLIRGERANQYEAIYGGYRDLQRMVTDGRYKLILYPKIDKILLFDLVRDPHEMNDLARQPRYGKVTERLFSLLKKQQKEMGDSLDVGRRT